MSLQNLIDLAQNAAIPFACTVALAALRVALRGRK